jgi:8-oxo-dGTP pyrophosphatase MutT (NUDIX family)
MESKEDVIGIVKEYLKLYKGEDQNKLVNFLNENELLFDRNNFNGHITASAFVVDVKREELLLLKHKLYDRYLQPGGHVENDDKSILEASLREACEETGIPGNELKYLSLNPSNDIPLDIDSHYIPANPRKNEPEHFHHDFRYLLVYDGDKSFTVPPSEAKDAKWVPFSELAEKGLFAVAVKKIGKVLS